MFFHSKNKQTNKQRNKYKHNHISYVANRTFCVIFIFSHISFSFIKTKVGLNVWLNFYRLTGRGALDQS